MRDDRFTPITLDTLRIFALIAVSLIPWTAAIGLGMLIDWLFQAGVCRGR